jgi:methylenetetrahydrofolate reductase (NADPH)
MAAVPGRRIGRSKTLDATESAALARLLAAPTFELLPLKSVGRQIEALPRGAHVSVTASPGKGLEATFDLAAELRRRGFAAVPHLSARMVRDRAQLGDLLAMAAASDLRRVFVIGGDAETPGPYADGVSLLRAIHEVGPVPAALGIPCYPDGHALIPDDVLLAALRAKLPFAAWMTTQLCFDARKIGGWLAARRAEGVTTPAVIGIPGVTEPRRLLAASAKIGLRDTRRFLAKNLGFVARLARSGGFYRPDGLVRDLAPVIADPAMDVEGLHLYTFNQVGPTEAWRTESLARLAGSTTPA